MVHGVNICLLAAACSSGSTGSSSTPAGSSPASQAVSLHSLAKIPGLRPVQAGSLDSAAPVESFTAVLLQINARYKTRAAIRITGLDI